MTRASPFAPRTVLALLAVGGAALLLLLYAIGAGWNGRDERNGGAHAAATGLNGFAGLARLLQARGHAVTLSRSEARLDDEGLLVLTPQVFADGEAIAEIIDARRYVGPTLLILPKWLAAGVERTRAVDVPEGWVTLGHATAPEWIGEIEGFGEASPTVAERTRWDGMGHAGALPVATEALALESDSVAGPGQASVLPLVTDEAGNLLAGYFNDDGDYPALDDASGYLPPDDLDAQLRPVVVVVEPDLMNNYGMADLDRARLALALVAAAVDRDPELPIVFDLTLAGLGRSENLLTLAFRPPFLAATLCLTLAALVVAWRAFRRFGPPVADAPAVAMGKRQLATNGAGLIERAKRLHLLGPPYAALVTARIASALGLREADPEARERAVAEALAARGLDDYPARLEALRRARHPADLLRAAGALKTIERTLTP